MYRVVICDDDEIIAEGIASFVPWKKLGMELSGICFNGGDAQKLIDDFHPDILISDVCMPGTSGLELAKYGKKYNQDLEVIIISGYDDFKYVQGAIRLEAVDYLLKPIDEEDLICSLKKCIKRMNQKEVNSNVAVGNCIFNKHELEELINRGKGEYASKFGDERLQELIKASFGMCMVWLDDYENLCIHLTAQNKQDVREIFLSNVQNHHGVVFEYSDGECVFYLVGNKPVELIEKKNEIVCCIRKQIGDLYEGQTVSSVCSNFYESMGDADKAVNELREASHEKYSYPFSTDINYRAYHNYLKDKENIRKFVDISDVQEIVDAVMRWNIEDVKAKIGSLKEKIIKQGVQSYLYMRVLTAGLLGLLTKELDRNGVNDRSLGIDSLEVYKQMTKAANLDEAMNILQEMLIELVTKLKNDNQQKYRHLILEAERYVENHYPEHELSFLQVANYVHISPSYFSVLFKNVLGISFTDYLIAIRIEKSKELIQNTDLKTYEIASRVGYATASYYSTAFKKITGMSPSEYKQFLNKT